MIATRGNGIGYRSPLAPQAVARKHGDWFEICLWGLNFAGFQASGKLSLNQSIAF